MTFFEHYQINSIDEMKHFAKNKQNLGKNIKFNELNYVLISNSIPEQKYESSYGQQRFAYECTINSVSSTWKDGNGILLYIEY